MIVVTLQKTHQKKPPQNTAPRHQRHAPSSVSQRCSCSSTARRRRRACRALVLGPWRRGSSPWVWMVKTMKPAETLFFFWNMFFWENISAKCLIWLADMRFLSRQQQHLKFFFPTNSEGGILSAKLDSTKLRGALHAIKTHLQMGAGLKQLEATTTRVTWCWNMPSNHKKTCRPASNVSQQLTLGLQYSFQTNPNPFFKEIDSLFG